MAAYMSLKWTMTGSICGTNLGTTLRRGFRVSQVFRVFWVQGLGFRVSRVFRV